MERKLSEEIENYLKMNPVRFHVPSHKGKGNLFDNTYLRDITELPFSDNLNDPNSIIQIEEQKASEIFNSHSTLFTVNGATAAVMTSMMATIKPREKLLLPTNSHISCYYGAIHADAQIIPLKVKNFATGVTYEEVLSALAEHNDINVCVITNPTYYGCCNDIEKICRELHKHDITVIVDESHGTHFHFSDLYPVSAVDCCADIVVHSGHKTINGLTQTGLIHLISKKIDTQAVRSKLRLVQSTSPSYLLLLSLIDAIQQLKTSSNILNKINIWYNSLESELNKNSFFTLLNHRLFLDGQTYNYDPMKLYLSASDKEISGYDLAGILESKFAIYSEMSDDDCVLLVSGLNATKNDYSTLLDALESIRTDNNKRNLTKNKFEQDPYCYDHKQVLSIRDAYFSDSEYKEFVNTTGEISAEFVMAYPPGVPILIPGSLIDNEVITTIKNSKKHFNGILNGYIKIVKR